MGAIDTSAQRCAQCLNEEKGNGRFVFTLERIRGPKELDQIRLHHLWPVLGLRTGPSSTRAVVFCEVTGFRAKVKRSEPERFLREPLRCFRTSHKAGSAVNG